jgi:hypothetical protein
LYLTINEPEKVRVTYSPYVSSDDATVTYVWDFAHDDAKMEECLAVIFFVMQDVSWKIDISDTLENKFSLKKSANKDRIDKKLVEESPDYVHEPK